MKRIVSLILIALLTLSVFIFTGCGAINKSEVSILWSGDGEVKVPNSLINSMDRAMYIENISYVHYGANGDAAEQIKQAKAAIDKGCSALLVELVSPMSALEIVNAAKEKDVPVVFFNTLVDKAVVESYDKCVFVSSAIDTVADVQGQIIADYVKANFKKLDANTDGKINYVAYGTGVISTAAVKRANELLATEDYTVQTADKKKINTSIVFYDSTNIFSTLAPIAAGKAQAEIMEKDEKAIELIVTESDLVALDVLCALQDKDYNTNKLNTHFIPIFTVGEEADYKAYVLAGRPEIPSDLIIKDGDSDKVIKQKNKDIKKIADLKEYYEKNVYLVDLTYVNESELDEMIYTTINVIDSGRISGTVIADNDTIAVSVAKIVRNFIKGNGALDGIASKVKDGEVATVVVEGSIVSVRYKAYTK